MHLASMYNNHLLSLRKDAWLNTGKGLKSGERGLI